MTPKTILYCWTWLIGPGWPQRVQKYLDYYRPLKPHLGFESFFLADNASPWPMLEVLKAQDVMIHRFDEPMGHHGGTNQYPYVWRGFYFIQKLIELGFEKIIICDSDSFIISQRLAEFIRDTNHGFYALWSETSGYPLSEISVLNQDYFPTLLQWFEPPWRERVKKSDAWPRFETEVPYSHVYKNFIGDRYGFIGAPPDESKIDFFTQAAPEKPMTFIPTHLDFKKEENL